MNVKTAGGGSVAILSLLSLSLVAGITGVVPQASAAEPTIRQETPPVDPAASKRSFEKPRITLTAPRIAPMNMLFPFKGRLKKTGERNTKKVVLQQRRDGRWVSVHVLRRRDDGRYSFQHEHPRTGTLYYRTVVKKHGDRLDVSPVRKVRVLDLVPPSYSPDPQPPGQPGASGPTPGGVDRATFRSTGGLGALMCGPTPGHLRIDAPSNVNTTSFAWWMSWPYQWVNGQWIQVTNGPGTFQYNANVTPYGKATGTWIGYLSREYSGLGEWNTTPGTFWAMYNTIHDIHGNVVGEGWSAVNNMPAQFGYYCQV